MLAIVSSYEPGVVLDASRYVVGATAALLLVAMNGQMLGLARLAYSLATNRRSRAPWAACTAAGDAVHDRARRADRVRARDPARSRLPRRLRLRRPDRVSIAHLAVIRLRFREPDRPSAFRVPLSVGVRGARVPLPGVFGALISVFVWISIVIYHEGARVIGAGWMVAGVTLYVVYRRGQGKSLTQRFTIPAEALQEGAGAEYGSILVPVFGEELDDDIVGTGTARRLGERG